MVLKICLWSIVIFQQIIIKWRFISLRIWCLILYNFFYRWISKTDSFSVLFINIFDRIFLIFFTILIFLYIFLYFFLFFIRFNLHLSWWILLIFDHLLFLGKQGFKLTYHPYFWCLWCFIYWLFYFVYNSLECIFNSNDQKRIFLLNCLDIHINGLLLSEYNNPFDSISKLWIDVICPTNDFIGHFSTRYNKTLIHWIIHILNIALILFCCFKPNCIIAFFH